MHGDHNVWHHHSQVDHLETCPGALGGTREDRPIQNFSDRSFLLDGGDDFQGTTATRTMLDVNIEHPLEQTCPADRNRGRGMQHIVIRIGCITLFFLLPGIISERSFVFGASTPWNRHRKLFAWRQALPLAVFTLDDTVPDRAVFDDFRAQNFGEAFRAPSVEELAGDAAAALRAFHQHWNSGGCLELLPLTPAFIYTSRGHVCGF